MSLDSLAVRGASWDLSGKAVVQSSQHLGEPCFSYFIKKKKRDTMVGWPWFERGQMPVTQMQDTAQVLEGGSGEGGYWL